MPKSYSGDLRERVIEAVELGASRREAAERFEVSVSSAVKWLQRWRESGSAAPKQRGGSVSPLEEHGARVLDVVAEQPDLTLVETVAELRKQRIRTSRSSLWRFLDRHDQACLARGSNVGARGSHRLAAVPRLGAVGHAGDGGRRSQLRRRLCRFPIASVEARGTRNAATASECPASSISILLLGDEIARL
jgi:transposase